MQRGFIAFHTETTGVDVASERIVTAAAVVFVGGEETEIRKWLIKVNVDIPERATAVHGITSEVSQNQGIDQREALADIKSFLVNSGLPVVCFNSQFDRIKLAVVAGRLSPSSTRPRSSQARGWVWLFQ